MPSAVLVIDMLNTYEHEDAEQLMASVRRALPGIRRLVERAREAGVTTVYVNDNHGDWSSGRSELTEQALRGPDPALVEPIAPPEGSVLLTKARHSAFYETQLEYLLREQGVDRVVLSGQVTEQCILYTALDAYVRGFDVVVPRDAVAGIREDLARAALEMMQLNMHAELSTAAEIDLGAALSTEA
jgi:nicotinamidase-related amidase